MAVGLLPYHTHNGAKHQPPKIPVLPSLSSGTLCCPTRPHRDGGQLRHILHSPVTLGSSTSLSSSPKSLWKSSPVLWSTRRGSCGWGNQEQSTNRNPKASPDSDSPSPRMLTEHGPLATLLSSAPLFPEMSQSPSCSSSASSVLSQEQD